jgi:hypothetical protein
LSLKQTKDAIFGKLRASSPVSLHNFPVSPVLLYYSHLCVRRVPLHGQYDKEISFAGVDQLGWKGHTPHLVPQLRQFDLVVLAVLLCVPSNSIHTGYLNVLRATRPKSRRPPRLLGFLRQEKSPQGTEEAKKEKKSNARFERTYLEG